MNWQECKNILCIRPDNMGDLIMTAPAIRALKESFNAKITVLTSSMAKGVIRHIPEIDDAIIYDLPWVKTVDKPATDEFNQIVTDLKERSFDAAVIFTVYSQNPLPAAMLAYLAGIPRILAYCRENPYQLLTNWVADKEPYTTIRHQVRRDLDLVATVGAVTSYENLYLTVDEGLWPSVRAKLTGKGVDLSKPWLVLHPGVSEKKREYPLQNWAETASALISEKGYQVLVSGTTSEGALAQAIQDKAGDGCFSVAGLLNLDEFIFLIRQAPVLLSVNTGTIHIAAAVGTPVVVLYAQTNPQHTPWMVPHKVLPFPLPAHLRSRNEVIAYVNKTVYSKPQGLPTPADIINAVTELVNQPGSPPQPSPGIPNENRALAAS